MKLYAELPGQRAGQITGDVLTLVWVAIWVRIGLWIHSLINRLKGPGRAMEDAGNRFAGTLETFGGRVAEVPVVGGTLREPVEAAAGAGRALEQAGLAQQQIVGEIALALAILLAAVPILLVLVTYLPGRLRWMREAGVASRIRLDAGDLYLFALRAAANRPLEELRAVTSDPGGALARGEYEGLAALELRALGLKV